MGHQRLDISASVRSRLPRELRDKMAESEAVLGSPVTFFEDPSIPGGAGAAASPDGVVRVAPGRAGDLNVLGEEIMHVHRWTSGYPIVEPTEVARRCGYARGLTQLAGHFDEYAFFPFLEGLGPDPRAALTPAMEGTAVDLRRVLPEIAEDPNTAEWRVLLAVIAVQARLLAPPSSARDRLMRMFEDPTLHVHAARGERLSAEITGAGDETPADVERRLGRCIHEVLGISADGATIRRLH